MLVAVTGATGFVGRHVVDQLAEAGHDVIAYGRRPAAAGLLERCVRYQAWDLTAGPIEAPRGVQAVVHCAARVADWGPFAAFHAANVAGTQTVLQSFPPAARVIYISSASVYDLFSTGRPLREDAPVGRALNFYAQTKLSGERLVRASGRSAVVLRPHAIYGPHDTTLLPRLLAARRFGRLLAIGTGKNRISLTHVRNLAQAVLLALDARLNFTVFNVADGETLTVDEVLRALLRELGLPRRVLYLPTRPAWSLATLLEGAFRRRGAGRAPLLTRYIVAQMALDTTLSIDKARAEIGYRPLETYRAGLPETVAAYLASRTAG